MNELQTCLCFVLAIVLTLPAAVDSNTPKELRLVAWITLCVAAALLAGCLALISQIYSV